MAVSWMLRSSYFFQAPRAFQLYAVGVRRPRCGFGGSKKTWPLVHTQAGAEDATVL